MYKNGEGNNNFGFHCLRAMRDIHVRMVSICADDSYELTYKSNFVLYANENGSSR